MAHKFNPFPKHSVRGHKSKVFQTVMLIIIATICTGYIFYLSMYKTETKEVIREIRESIETEMKNDDEIIVPVKPELIDLTLINSDLNAIESNLKTVDSLESL